MAYNTKVLDAVSVGGEIDWAERSYAIHGAFTLAKSDGEMFNLEAIKAAKKRFDHVTKVPVIKRGNVTINASRSLTIAAPGLDSEFLAVTFVTLASDIVMQPAAHYGNYVDYQKALATQITDIQRAWRAELDSLVVAQLILNRTQVDGTAGNPYALVGDIYQVPAADVDYWYNEINAIFTYNDFDGKELNILGSPRVQTIVNKINENAVYNAENKALRIQDKNFYFSKNVPFVNDMGAFALTKGSIGIMNWNNPEASMPRVTTQMNPDGELGLATFNEIGFDVEVLEVLKRANLSGTLGAGNETASVVSFQFASEFAIIGNYISDRVAYPSNVAQLNIGI
jgi:hypothetical protein